MWDVLHSDLGHHNISVCWHEVTVLALHTPLFSKLGEGKESSQHSPCGEGTLVLGR